MPTNASGSLVTALKTSLATPAHAWVVLAVQEIKGPTQRTVAFTIPENAVDSVPATPVSYPITRFEVDTMIVALKSPRTARLTYVSNWKDAAFLDGRIYHRGTELVTTDAPLDTTVRGMAATFLAAGDASLITALNS